jgi:hypothetical protein
VSKEVNESVVQVKKSVKSKAIAKPVTPSPAKPTKRGTRGHPQPKTPAKEDKVSKTVVKSPKVL